MKSAAAFAAIVAILIPAALSAEVILWRLADSATTGVASSTAPSASYDISPVAIQTDGQTVYGAQEIKSLSVFSSAGFVTTHVATTVTFTFSADASQFHLAHATESAGVSVEITDDCILQSDGKVVCSIKGVARSGNKETTVATTTTGVPTPWYTISNVNLPTTASAASSITPVWTRQGALVMGSLVGLGLGVGVMLV